MNILYTIFLSTGPAARRQARDARAARRLGPEELGPYARLPGSLEGDADSPVSGRMELQTWARGSDSERRYSFQAMGAGKNGSEGFHSRLGGSHCFKTVSLVVPQIKNKQCNPLQ